MSSTKINPSDLRYRAVLEKRFNKRLTASSDYVRLAESAERVMMAIKWAVSENSVSL